MKKLIPFSVPSKILLALNPLCINAFRLFPKKNSKKSKKVFDTGLKPVYNPNCNQGWASPTASHRLITRPSGHRWHCYSVAKWERYHCYNASLPFSRLETWKLHSYPAWVAGRSATKRTRPCMALYVTMQSKAKKRSCDRWPCASQSTGNPCWNLQGRIVRDSIRTVKPDVHARIFAKNPYAIACMI